MKKLRNKVALKLIKQSKGDDGAALATMLSDPKFERLLPNRDPKPGEKIIPITDVKSISVKRVRYSEDQTEAVFHTIAHIAAIRDAQLLLKGTEFYSASMEREMEKISSTKLMPIFKQNDPGYISDTVIAMARMFSQMCDFSYQLSKQPQKIQDRFHTEYTNLLISCGVGVKEQ